MNLIQYNPLFADLTPEQAATVAGGAVQINTIEALRVSADPVGGDEPYLNANGRRIWSGALEQGGSATINKRISENTLVTLYDDDPWPNPDDPIGTGKTLDRSDNGVEYFSGGSGSSLYRLTFKFV